MGGVAQDLGRGGGERVDGSVDVVAGGTSKPYQSIRHLQRIEEVEQGGIAGETMVVILFDPVIADPVRTEAAARNGPLLKEIYLVCPGEFESRDQTGQTSPPTTQIFIIYPYV